MAKILIVDDLADDVGFLARELTALGYEVATALEARGALAAAESEHPDAILVGVSPPGAAGVEICRRLNSEPRLARIPIIMVSRRDEEDLAVTGLDAGAQDFITVPLNPTLLAAHVRAAVRVKESNDRLAKTGADQLVSRDDFLFHVSHELRTPLSAVYQFVTNMADGLAGEVTHEQHECLDVILRNVSQMEAMIRDLIEVTRVGTGKLRIEPRPIDLSPVVGEVLTAVREAAAAKQLTVAADLPSHMPPAFADQTRVRQILSNLVENAIKFTPPRGLVTVRAGVADTDAKLLRVTVEDTGCGMEPEAARRIFERLYQAPASSTAARKGLGLGLYIARELVVRQGGTIWLDTEPGRGSAFSFTLPTCSIERAAAVFGKTPHRGASTGATAVGFA